MCLPWTELSFNPSHDICCLLYQSQTLLSSDISYFSSDLTQATRPGTCHVPASWQATTTFKIQLKCTLSMKSSYCTSRLGAQWSLKPTPAMAWPSVLYWSLSLVRHLRGLRFWKTKNQNWNLPSQSPRSPPGFGERDDGNLDKAAVSKRWERSSHPRPGTKVAEVEHCLGIMLN